MPDTKRILIVDDHPLLREGLESVLKVEPDIEVCGDAASVSEALEMVEKSEPDLVITDLSLPDRNGLDLIKDLKVLRPDLLVLVVSMHDENTYAERALRAGACGYIMKEAALDRIAEAIRRVLTGEIYVSESVTRRFLRDMARNKPGSATAPLKRLSDREMEVFELIGLGKNIQEIAAKLRISPRTVSAHRGNIREKLGLRSDALVLRATRWTETGQFD